MKIERRANSGQLAFGRRHQAGATAASNQVVAGRCQSLTELAPGLVTFLPSTAGNQNSGIVSRRLV
jgi:hypothetical protein